MLLSTKPHDREAQRYLQSEVLCGWEITLLPNLCPQLVPFIIIKVSSNKASSHKVNTVFVQKTWGHGQMKNCDPHNAWPPCIRCMTCS